MPQDKPWEKYGVPAPAPSTPGPITVGRTDPTQPLKVPAAKAELTRTEVSTANTRSEMKNRTDTFDRQNTQNRFQNTEAYRKEYNGLPSVQAYTMVMPVYVAGLKTAANGAGDQDLVTAFAKVMDPATGVREGEAASVSNAQPILDARVQALRNQLNSSGQFTPQFRSQLRGEMRNRVSELHSGYINERVRYKEMATRNGIDPRDVVGSVGFGERYRGDVEKYWGKTEPQLDWSGNPIPGTGGKPVTGGSLPPPLPPVDISTLGGGLSGVGSKETLADLSKSVPDPVRVKYFNDINSLSMAGAPDRQFLALAQQAGMAPPTAFLSWRRGKPGWRGPVSTEDTLTKFEPNRDAVGAAVGAINNGTVGTFAANAGNEVGLGLPQVAASALSGNNDAADAAWTVMNQNNPIAAMSGKLVGGTAGFIAPELAAVKGLNAIRAAKGAEPAGEVGQFFARRGADSFSSGVSGWAGAPDGQGARSAAIGAVLGPLTGVFGEGFGRYALEPALRAPARGMFGAPRTPSPAELAISKAANKTGPGDIFGKLSGATDRNLPLTLADTSPELRSLAGAAVRRSPSASGFAENVLLPRNRGQIERFQGGIESNLGPATNVPQLTDDLIQSARNRSRPLYALADPQPIVSDEVDSLLQTPFGKQALGAADKIAANERIDPNTRAWDLDSKGNLVMRPAPTTRSLDLVKRGMDAVLEPQRNPMTGVLSMSDPAIAAQDGVRKAFLSEIDRINPDYKAAREAYAGPAAEKDFIRRGQDAFRAPPDKLAFDLSRLPPAKLPMMQLGFRDALWKAGDAVRFSSNPFEATLGNPAAEARLRTMYPDKADNMFGLRDAEREMQNTSNDILGNSKTAQRTIADEAFGNGGWIGPVADGVSALTSGVPVATAARMATSRGLRAKLGDMTQLGVGKSAVRNADEMIPYLLDTNPEASARSLGDLLTRSGNYDSYLRRRRGMFGAPAGVVGAGIGAYYGPSLGSQ